MSSTDKTIQVNIRAGEELHNVYANSKEELEYGLNTLAELTGLIATTKAALTAGGLVAAPQQGVAPVAPQPAAPAVPGAWTPPGGAVAPAVAPTAFQAPPAAAPAATPQGPGPQCPHGAMKFKSGNGRTGAWSAWMCPTPKNTPGQCKPIDAITGEQWG